MSKPTIIIVGLAPPPYHGQSIATGMLFDHDWAGLNVEKLPVRYSKDVTQIGKPSLSKVFHMFGLVIDCWKLRFRSKAKVLYYTPASGSFVPFVRDVVFLLFCRPLFKRVLLHYHAGGLPEWLEESFMKRTLGKIIFGRGAWSISLTEGVSVPSLEMGASRLLVQPNGVVVPDRILNSQRENGESFNILFLGNLYEDKGVFEAIESASKLGEQTDVSITLTVVGAFPNDSAEKELRQAAEKAHCDVSFLGIRKGEEKWDEFLRADVFLFPSFYSCENQPLVILEAMAAGLPIVASSWRGIPEQVIDGETGLIVNVHDIKGYVEALHRLLNDRGLAQQMGNAGRERYLQNYTTEAHIAGMRKIFEEALSL